MPLTAAPLALASAGCARLEFLPPAICRRCSPTESRGPDAMRKELRGRFDFYPYRLPGESARRARRDRWCVFFYGGELDAGSKNDYRFVGAALAAHGHVTVLPDYRLYPAVHVSGVRPGCGARRRRRRRRRPRGHGADAGASCWSAIPPARTSPRISRSIRSWLHGGRRGSAQHRRLHRSLGAVRHRAELRRAAAIFDAVSTPDEYRPLRHVRAGAPPSLLLHGATDDIVGVQHSERLAAALRAVGTPVTLTIFPRPWACRHGRRVVGASAQAHAEHWAIAAFLAGMDSRPAHRSSC